MCLVPLQITIYEGSMKNLPEMEDSILNSSSVSMLVKLTIDPSRTYFEKLEDDNPFDAGDYSEVTDDPVGQCMIYSSYMDDIFTFVVNKDTGAISGMKQGDSTKYSLGISADTNTKPSVREIGNGNARIMYWNNGLYEATVNLSTLTASGAQEISISGLSSSTYWDIVSGSPTILDENAFVLCYKTSKGGIGVVIKIGIDWFHWRERFMSPNCLSEEVWSIYTSAIIFKGKIYVYSTDIDTGEVRAVEFVPSKQTWSDIFIALPADFSRFDITNAIVANGYVHLAGQFHRVDDHSDAKVYSLILRSSNGKNFSWDRFTLLSDLGYQFHVAINNTTRKVYASDRNSVGIADMSYYFSNNPNGRVVFSEEKGHKNKSIINFSTSVDSATIRLSAANEENIDHETIRKSNRVIVELCYKDHQYVRYGTYIIDKVDKRWKDGSRVLNLNLINEGLWKTNQIAFPFYAEILSKSSQYDNCDELDKMYVVSCASNEGMEYFTVDFWDSEEWDGDGEVTTGTEYSFSAPPQAEVKYTNFKSLRKGKTVNLNAHPLMTSYPTITGDMTEVRLYGWETGNSSGRNNSTFTLYAVTAPEFDLDNKTVVQGVCTSAHQNFPKENFSTASVGTQAGSYPITFSFTGLEVGQKLLYFGVTMTNATDGYSYLNLERIQVHDGVDWNYSSLTSSTPWSLETPPGEDRQYLMSPDTGIQNLMFTTKPYSTFNFNISAEFGYDGGDEQLSAGTTAWGVVGIGKDGNDYFLARHRRQSSKVELCIMRGGKITILASHPSSEVYDIMLDHRNGQFRVWTKTSEEWIKIITHVYDEITHGVMSTSETGIMHTGIYAAVEPPRFIAAAFSQPYSAGICMTTHQTKQVLDDGFPPSGNITIDGVKYSYDGKTTQQTNTSRQYGPYQLRQVSNILAGLGIEIALYKPELSSTAVKNLLLGQSNGHTWHIESSDWQVVHSTGGSPDYLRNRSRHYFDSTIYQRYFGGSISDRTYIGHGLLNVELESDRPYRHRNGCLVSLYSTDKIWVKKVTVSQVDHDATVEDMLTYLCHVASIDAVFPGNWQESNFQIGTTPVQLAEDQTIFPGGANIYFGIASNVLTENKKIFVHPTNLILSETDETIQVGVENYGGKLRAFIIPSGTSPAEYIETDMPPDRAHDFRVLIHGDFVSIYASEVSLATFAIGEEKMEWPEDALEVEMSSSHNMTLNYVLVGELFDWREAIYIESELSVSSAIGSVIQERPIDIYSTENGDLSFSYNFVRDTVTYTEANSHRVLREHSEIEQNSDNAGSDALVYYADVAFTDNEQYAKEDGFSTRVFRLSNLETGARLAARLILEKAFEKQFMHSFQMRPDLRLEIGDIVDFTYVISGTQRTNNPVGVIENINISIEEGRYNMNLTARRKDIEE
jgi:hypothetical protein